MNTILITKKFIALVNMTSFIKVDVFLKTEKKESNKCVKFIAN